MNSVRAFAPHARAYGLAMKPVRGSPFRVGRFGMRSQTRTARSAWFTGGAMAYREGAPAGPAEHVSAAESTVSLFTESISSPAGRVVATSRRTFTGYALTATRTRLARICAEHRGQTGASALPKRLGKRCVARHCGVSGGSGYIGESTTREIGYAKATGKPVRYLEVRAGPQP